MSLAENLRGKRRSVVTAGRLVSIIGTLVIGPRASGEERPIPTDEAGERRWVAELGEGFSLVRSDHFVLAHDVDSVVADQYLVWMEETYGRVGDFLRATGVPVRALSGRLEAACSKRWDVYRRIRGAVDSEEGITSGVYDHTSRRTYFGYLPESEKQGAGELDQPGARSLDDRSPTVAARFGEGPTEMARRLTVRHETAHQVVDALCPGLRAAVPEWLSEGLACAFEGDATVGRKRPPLWNEWRARDFEERFGGAGDGPARVIAVIRRPWSGEDSVELPLPQRYAIAWAVVSYLGNERLEAFAKYLGHAASRQGPLSSAEGQALWEREIGEPDEAFALSVIGHIGEANRRAR